mmetsp:Transcript_93641/g.297133  ORF Transcript_93641/g.297133 Transcript_93641/m.297133 type:complete len:257 (+) Transcript_93641:64-834(+)
MVTSFNVSMFSVCLMSRPGSPGYFVWGDDSASHYPSLFKKVPVLGRHTWTVKMEDVRLVPRTMTDSRAVHISCQDGCGAIVDSGTSLLMVPSTVVRTIEDALGELDADCRSMKNLPHLAFNLGGHTFSLPPDAYLAEVGAIPSQMASLARLRVLSSRTGSCQLTIMESYSSTDWGPLWILGMPFFRKYYTTFHVGRSHADRELLIAPATPACYPGEPEPVLARAEEGQVYRRTLDLSKMYISPLAKEASLGTHMSL